MKIEARMKLKGRGNLLASGDVILDDFLVLRNVRYIQRTEKDGTRKERVYLPSFREKDEWMPSVHIQSTEIWKKIEEAVKKSAWEQYYCGMVLPEIFIDMWLQNGRDGLKAEAAVTYAGAIRLEGLRIYEKDGEKKVLWPDRFTDEKAFSCYDVTTDYTRNYIEDELLKAYEQKKLKEDTELSLDLDRRKYEL